MSNNRRSQLRSICAIMAGFIAGMGFFMLILFGAAQTTSAQEVETGNVCIGDYLNGNPSCTANDVGLTIVNQAGISAACSSGAISTTVDLRVKLVANQPQRYDLGIFIAQDSGSAISGDNCYHAMVTPTTTFAGQPISLTSGVGPFSDIDGDLCSDIDGAGTEAFYELYSVTIPCDDSDNNGFIEVSACTSWDNNTNTVCTDVTGAIPGTGAKCNCQVLQIPLVPSAVTLGHATIERQNSQVVPLLATLVILALVTVAILRRRDDAQSSP